jgi:ring-1,2-phenylacetyl-CoA epoxidase subunit PaaC
VTASFQEVLGLADDALIAAQRLAEWSSRAPEMEEDVALTNIALDQLGAARHLLSYAGELEGAGRDENALAYLRDDHEFRNVLLVELPNGDFAVTIAKLLFLAAYQRDRYRQLAGPLSGAGSERRGRSGGDGLRQGEDERLAGIAATAVKESAYHLDHAALWTIRLGDGTEESHRRMQSAVDDTWPYTDELFDGNDLRDGWLATVEPVLAQATLTRPAEGGWAPRGGRAGRHTEHLSHLLGEMQVLHRAHPGAAW